MHPFDPFIEDQSDTLHGEPDKSNESNSNDKDPTHSYHSGLALCAL